MTKVLYIGILSRDLRCFRVLATIPLGDRRESRFASRVGIGSDLAVGQIRRRPSRVGAPHGANYDAYANSERVPRPWRDGFASLTGQTREGCARNSRSRIPTERFAERKRSVISDLDPPTGGERRSHKLRPSRGNLCDLRRIFVGPLAERSSPSEPSLANSGAIRSDGCKNPSAYYALA